MITRALLDSAVSRAIITREQREALLELAGGENPEQTVKIDFSVSADDEPFRLLKGFRDFFIAIGIVILAVGLSMFVQGPFDLVMDGNAGLAATVQSGWIAALSMLVLLAAAIVISEWVTKSQRLPLSSLVLTLIFALWAGLFCGSLVYAGLLSSGIGPESAGMLRASVTYSTIFGSVIALIIYYRRYKLPFVLLPLAGVGVLGVVVMLNGFFDFDNNSLAARMAIGICGVGVFVVAMWYDMKDRYRTTRLSECAFWLHLLAAPMIVHAVLFDGMSGTLGALTILLVVAVLAISALIIDRRAILVSALSYLGYSIFAIVKGAGFFGEFNNSATMVIVGIFVLGLGLGWSQIRRFFVTNLVWKSLRDKLPPVVA